MAQPLRREPFRRSVTHLRLLGETMSVPDRSSLEEHIATSKDQTQSSRWSLSTNGTPLNSQFPNNLSLAELSQKATASTSSLRTSRRKTVSTGKSRVNVLTKSRAQPVPPLPDSILSSEFLDLSDGHDTVRSAAQDPRRSRLDSKAQGRRASWLRRRKSLGRMISYPSKMLHRVLSRSSMAAVRSRAGDDSLPTDKALPALPTNNDSEWSDTRYQKLDGGSWQRKDDVRDPSKSLATELRQPDSPNGATRLMPGSASAARKVLRLSRSLSGLRHKSRPSAPTTSPQTLMHGDDSRSLDMSRSATSDYGQLLNNTKEAQDTRPFAIIRPRIDSFDTILEFYSSEAKVIIPRTRSDSIIQSPIVKRGKDRPFPVSRAANDTDVATVGSGVVQRSGDHASPSETPHGGASSGT